MSTLPLPDELRDHASDFVLGLLSQEERWVFAEHLKECPECLAEVRQFEQTVEQLALLSAAQPPPQLRERLLRETTPLPQGIFAARSHDLVWKPTPFPGVVFKPLYQHPVTQQVTQLFRLSAGAEVPRHYHTGDEQCLVLEGEVQMGSAVFHKGDFSVAVAGTTHDIVTTKVGCTLLIVSSPTDQLLPA